MENKANNKARGFLEYILRIVPPNVMEMYENTKVAKEIPEIMPFFRLWARNATILWIIHLSLGIITTILTIIITSVSATVISTTDNSASSTTNVSFLLGTIPILAVFAAITAALLTSLDIGTKSNNTRNAWRKLNTAMMKYNQGIFTTKELVINAYEEGEALISGINFTQLPTNGQNRVGIGENDNQR